MSELIKAADLPYNKNESGISNGLGVNTDLVFKAKRDEILKFFTALKNDDKEISLAFEAKPALLVSMGSIKRGLNVTSSKIMSHQFGFSHLGNGYYSDPETNQFINNINKEKNIDFVHEVLSFVKQKWEKKEYIIPIFPKSDDLGIKNQKRNAHAREKNQFLESGSKGSKLRRNKIASSKAGLTNFVEEQVKKSQAEKAKSTKKTAVKETDISVENISMLSLPDFLVDMNSMELDDIFCNLAKNMMLNAFRDEIQNSVNKQMNANSLKLLDLPDYGQINEDEKYIKCPLISCLHDYQKNTINKCEAWKDVQCGGIIADEPGLGKTVQGCEIMLRSLIENPEQPTLVIAPQLVKHQWVSEFWKYLDNTAKELARKAARCQSEPAVQKAGIKLLKLLNILILPKNSDEVLNEEEVERLYKLIKFYQTFKKNDIRVLESPKDFKELMEQAKKGNTIKGIIVAQYSYFQNQFNEYQKDFEKLNPSVVIIDEAHDLLSGCEKSGKLDKTLKFDYIFRQWKCPKIGLTATPLVNEMYDIADLLMLLTNKERKFQVAEHFERQLLALANKIIEIKHEYLNNNEELDEDFLKDKYQKTISSLIKKSLFTFLWFKENVINKRISRTTREEAQESANSDVTKSSFTIDVTPSEEQNKLHDLIYEKDFSFFTFNSLVSSLLVHPDLINGVDSGNYSVIKMENIGAVIKHINNLNSESEIDDYILRSGLLTNLFLANSENLDEGKTVADAMENDEKVIIFVSQKAQATFIEALAKKKFNLSEKQVLSVYSDKQDNVQTVEYFKQLKGKGILILLPKSGGAGLNFTDVSLNILVSIGWTHKDKEQCGGRHLRGKGKKFIGEINYPFKSAKHVENIIIKKQLISDLFLDKKEISEQNLNHYIEQIINTAKAMMCAHLSHCDPSLEWQEFLESFLDTIKFFELGSEYELWSQYQTLKSEADSRMRGLGKIASGDFSPEKSSSYQDFKEEEKVDQLEEELENNKFNFDNSDDYFTSEAHNYSSSYSNYTPNSNGFKKIKISTTYNNFNSNNNFVKINVSGQNMCFAPTINNNYISNINIVNNQYVNMYPMSNYYNFGSNNNYTMNNNQYSNMPMSSSNNFGSNNNYTTNNNQNSNMSSVPNNYNFGPANYAAHNDQHQNMTVNNNGCSYNNYKSNNNNYYNTDKPDNSNNDDIDLDVFWK